MIAHHRIDGYLFSSLLEEIPEHAGADCFLHEIEMCLERLMHDCETGPFADMPLHLWAYSYINFAIMLDLFASELDIDSIDDIEEINTSDPRIQENNQKKETTKIRHAYRLHYISSGIIKTSLLLLVKDESSHLNFESLVDLEEDSEALLTLRLKDAKLLIHFKEPENLQEGTKQRRYTTVNFEIFSSNGWKLIPELIHETLFVLHATYHKKSLSLLDKHKQTFITVSPSPLFIAYCFFNILFEELQNWSPKTRKIKGRQMIYKDGQIYFDESCSMLITFKRNLIRHQNFLFKDNIQLDDDLRRNLICEIHVQSEHISFYGFAVDCDICLSERCLWKTVSTGNFKCECKDKAICEDCLERISEKKIIKCPWCRKMCSKKDLINDMTSKTHRSWQPKKVLDSLERQDLKFALSNYLIRQNKQKYFSSKDDSFQMKETLSQTLFK
jgi:hypothetical protein